MYMNLNEAKTKALNEYKASKKEWLDTVTKDNIKGDFEKWKILCNAKVNCMRLGVRI